MAFFNKEKKKIVVENLKPILKKYGIKATVSVANKMEVCLNIKCGPLDFIANDQYQKRTVGGYTKLNLKASSEGFSGECKNFLDEAIAALKSADYYDNTDIMTDFFDTAYYYSIFIGNCNKPYELKKS